MPHRATNLPMTSTGPSSEARTVLSWRVHLMRRNPHRLTRLLFVLTVAIACVWMLFNSLLPVLVALLLLVGSATDYLFPISYRLTEEGVFAEGLTSRLALRWKEARRCLPDRGSVTLTPLETPSRLDEFRGVMLRFAPDGEPGDRASVMAVIAEYAPDALPQAAEPESSKTLL